MTGASPGRLGAMRGIAHAKITFEALNSFVYPETFTLSKANEAFNSDGDLKDKDQFSRLKSLVSDFHKFCERIS